jgi:hypothetical protein
MTSLADTVGFAMLIAIGVAIGAAIVEMLGPGIPAVIAAGMCVLLTAIVMRDTR